MSIGARAQASGASSNSTVALWATRTAQDEQATPSTRTRPCLSAALASLRLRTAPHRTSTSLNLGGFGSGFMVGVDDNTAIDTPGAALEMHKDLVAMSHCDLFVQLLS